MKFKINEDFFNTFIPYQIPAAESTIVIPEEELNLETPQLGQDTGIANILHDLIIDENEAIQGYNNAIANMTDYPEIINILKDIAAEEMLHTGQLEQALTLISPNAKNIMNGAIEAEEQLDPGSPIDENIGEKHESI